MKALEVGWAWAACAAGMKLADLDPNARASLVFNQGLVAKELDERSVAKELLEKSLHMRPAYDRGRREVMKQLEAIEP